MKGSEVVASCLSGYGIKYVFGIPGTGNVELVDAIHSHGIEFISMRHESAAAFAADGYARASLSPGVCCSTRSGGSLNMAIGVQNAFQESSPVVALLGQVERFHRYVGSFEEMDLTSAYSTFTKFSADAPTADRIGYIVGRALSVSRAGHPGPTSVTIPIDVQQEETAVKAPPTVHVPHPAPEPDAVKKAVDLLTTAEFPLIFTGGGVHWSGAHSELVELAEALGCGVIASWHRNDVFPNSHPLFLGMSGGGRAPVTADALGRADVILAVGCKFSQSATANYTAIPSDAKIIQLNTDAENMDRVYPPSIALFSDARLGLQCLIEESGRLGKVSRRKARAGDIRILRERWVRETTIPYFKSSKSPVHPLSMLGALRDVLPEDGVVVLDSGAFAHWVLRYIPFDSPGTLFGPSGGAMGFGLPAALGIKLALPDRRVFCVSGDGGFAMTMAELETAVRYDVRVTCLVMNNSAYANVMAKQDNRFGGHRVGTELGDVDFAAIADAMGGLGIRVEDADELPNALKDAGNHRGPSVVDVVVDLEQVSP